MTDWIDRARNEMDQKVKPPGSLGRLESLAVRLAAYLETLEPRVERGRVLIFAADHGVSREGVSAYPREVTAQMVKTFSSGGAAITVLARTLGLEVEVIDVGVDADLPEMPGVVSAKVRRSSRNFLEGPALTPEELDSALEAGRAAVDRAAGADTIALGEMGIGNTTAAAALLSALTGAPPEETVGRGTGVDDERLAHKRAVVAKALRLHERALNTPRTALATVGGLEMAALAGAAIEAACQRKLVLVDGFISTVSALAAVRMNPFIRPALFFAHRSAEAGHGRALEALEAEPLLDLGMRLGEGTGSALAFPILKAAAAILREMATFSQAGVSDKQ
ncbi:MAG TPA: nicotinate-nucleotide--dimethylbenzimidazole phosphoribosyltransferase [Thermoanaerobaculia bacterium]|jgi:nicotinate-nucleotide--dimethylbenzimidazole phosphoribosyltransferase|nr:nicotinate-nucleotide--dimethylbenzimidazole phosphoribosyltransferase [Thermoanaerobaculia bacterium]